MNREDIIRLAREAGFTNPEKLVTEDKQLQEILLGFWENLEAFATLVASAEREACAIVCDDLWEDDGTAYECAEAIRARGQA